MRLVSCPFAGCPQTFNRFLINKHKSECIYGKPKKCPKCDGELLADSDQHCCISSIFKLIKSDLVSKASFFSQIASIQQSISKLDS